MVEITESQTKTRTKKLSPVSILGGIAITSVGLAVLAIFTLAAWAETSVLSHGIQHVLIFLAGLGFGTSMLGIYQLKGKNHES